MSWFPLTIEVLAAAFVVVPTLLLPRAWQLAPGPVPPWWLWSERGWLRFIAAGPAFTVALWGLPTAYLTAVFGDPPRWVRVVSLVGAFWSVALLPFALFVYATLRPRLFIPPKYRDILRKRS